MDVSLALVLIEDDGEILGEKPGGVKPSARVKRGSGAIFLLTPTEARPILALLDGIVK